MKTKNTHPVWLARARRTVGYGLVIIWALVGIAVKQSANQNVVTTTEVSAIIVAVALVLSVLLFRTKRQKGNL